MNDLNLDQALEKMQIAARKFVMVDDETVNRVLLRLADLLEERMLRILEVNMLDLGKIDDDDS